MSFISGKDEATTERITKKKSPINRTRMKQALNSGKATKVPHGLPREEMRQFILNAQ
ncbi:MAG: hypothetical protein HLX50_15845 [Alteromonadaceae bacterium]|nr:hypothetical protein [Alteromonadaceae bacterium]